MMRPMSESWFGSPVPSASRVSPSSPPVSTPRVRVRRVPSLRASMNSVSPLRSGPPWGRFLPVLSRVRNQRQGDAGGKEELGRQGDDAVHHVGLDDALADRALPPEPLESEPLAMTKPATAELLAAAYPYRRICPTKTPWICTSSG
jgi:hypothetical protein